jgi:hypothetical protein
MITAYAILSTFFLGIFVRHNFKEMHAYYLLARASRKFEKARVQREKERQTASQKVGPNPFTS